MLVRILQPPLSPVPKCEGPGAPHRRKVSSAPRPPSQLTFGWIGGRVLIPIAELERFARMDHPQRIACRCGVGFPTSRLGSLIHCLCISVMRAIAFAP